MSAPSPPEFSRIVRIDQIGRLAATTHISAKEAERTALARRFRLLALDRLDADYALSMDGTGIVARGRVRAALAQPCVATGVPVPESIDTDFTLRFVRDDAPMDEGAELEIDAEDCDTIGYDGQVIDMGEAVAETVALAMAPYPRSPDADAVLREAGVIGEEQASPFAVLLALKGQGKK
ncbi:DUF177 domain-containing protein [Sphingobium sp. AN558]|uniref:YceD family protein n=1 Tax=Sphingobium sp. AN558 TaxID=3133442 RepID=UPI0030C15FF2